MSGFGLVLLGFVGVTLILTGLPAYAVLTAGGLSGGLLANVLFLRGLKRIPAPQASVLTLIEPVVAVLVGAVVWAEIPGPLSRRAMRIWPSPPYFLAA